jgi:hypothetical protein
MWQVERGLGGRNGGQNVHEVNIDELRVGGGISVLDGGGGNFWTRNKSLCSPPTVHVTDLQVAKLFKENVPISKSFKL